MRCGGRPTRLGRTGAAGGAGSATHGAQPHVRKRTEIEQDSGRGGKGEEERRGAVKLGPSAQRARLRARSSSSAPASASCAPPLPAACRPTRPALPGPPPTELCRYHFRREKRARAGALGLSARVSGSAVRLRLRAVMDVVRGTGRFCVRARGTPLLLGWCLPSFYTPAGCKGREHAHPRLPPATHSPRGGRGIET